VRRDAERVRLEADHARRCDEENRMLRSEVQAMWQQMRRVDPNNPHVFGNFTNQLAHEHTQPGAASSMLPPLQQSNQWTQPTAPMQGVEFPAGAGYDRR
jgi:hypothetical protein